jgi:hypothetical protein
MKMSESKLHIIVLKELDPESEMFPGLPGKIFIVSSSDNFFH